MASVFDEVQAALLNSECDPVEAVQQALKAVAQFSDLEIGLTGAAFAEASRKAWEDNGL